MRKTIFNALSGSFDVIDDDIVENSGAPSTGSTGTLYIDTTSPTDSYYFVGSDRYKLTAVLANPVGGLTGTPMGLLLALTYV